MPRYYYNISSTKTINWDTSGWCECPDVRKALQENPELHQWDLTEYDKPHSKGQEPGTYTNKILEDTKEETPDGVIHTSKILRYKIDKDHPIICKCGKPMEIEYSVWYEYTDPKVKTKVIGGLFSMRNGAKDKRYWTKTFKTKKAQKKFVDRFIAKHTK